MNQELLKIRLGSTVVMVSVYETPCAMPHINTNSDGIWHTEG
jgi:hypothetical protein